MSLCLRSSCNHVLDKMTTLTNDFIYLCVCVTGSLMYLNEATLLNNVRVRYSKDKIYVSIFVLLTTPNTDIRCKYSQHNQIQKRAANTVNTTKYRNVLQILTTQPNTETCCKYS